jgi:SEC-C motif-containing protein
MTETADCPCQSGECYAHCCGRFLDNGLSADTAEQLMRSRYTAYTLEREEYLLRTWHVSTRPAALNLSLSTPVKWLGLEIVRTQGGGPADTEGSVEFIARCKVNGKAERLHETSRFVREDGRWYYLDGALDERR